MVWVLHMPEEWMDRSSYPQRGARVYMLRSVVCEDQWMDVRCSALGWKQCSMWGRGLRVIRRPARAYAHELMCDIHGIWWVYGTDPLV